LARSDVEEDNMEKALILQRAFNALRPSGCLLLRDACSDASGAHLRVVWSERFAVWIRHNLTERGLHLASLAQHRMLLAETGFVDAKMPGKAGLGSNQELFARKPSGVEPSAQPRTHEGT
jgi:hypothetical protein